MTINHNGHVTQPSQPSFAAYTSSNSYTTSGNLVFMVQIDIILVVITALPMEDLLQQ